jgi:hypothetical protein
MKLGFVASALLMIVPSFSNAQNTVLPFRPIAAEYSLSLDRIVIISSGPERIHIYDPVTAGDREVALAKPPLSLAMSPDGSHAAVGHDGLISYVNLNTATLEKTFVISGPASNVALSPSWIYVTPPPYYREPRPLSVNIATAAVTPNDSLIPLSSGRLNTAFQAIYGQGFSFDDLNRYDVSAGPMTATANSVYHPDYPFCGPVFFSPDETRVYNGCGGVAYASSDAKLDRRYFTRISGVVLLQALTESAALKQVALIRRNTGTAVDEDTAVILHDSQYLNPIGRFPLADFAAGARTFKSHGKWVFFNAGGTALYAVVQADLSSGALNDYAIQKFTTPPAKCGAALAASNVQVGADGAMNTVSINAPPNCTYQALASASWLKLTNDAYGAGNGTVTYMVRANSGAARSAFITVGDSVLTVSQAAAVFQSTTRLPYKVVSAIYDKPLDKLVTISSNPNELHLYDPRTRIGADIPLPAQPLSVSVGADGLFAAVGHNGWVSYIDLQAGSVSKVFKVGLDAWSVLLAANGYLYLFPQGSGSSIHSLQISTSQVTITSATNAGYVPRLSTDGNYIHVSGGSYSKWYIGDGVAKRVGSEFWSGADHCFNGWVTARDSLLSSCGIVYHLSAEPSLDRPYLTTVAGADPIQSFAESPELKRVAIIRGPSSWWSPTDEGVVLSYDDEYFNPVGRFVLAGFPIGSYTFNSHGRWVFFSADGTALYAIVQAEEGSDALNDFAIQTFATRPASCGAATFSTSSASVTADGATGAVAVTAGINCTYQAVSTVPWLTIVSGGYGSGDGTLTYIARANRGAARSGTIALGDSVLTITQAARAGQETTRLLPHNVVGVAYDKPLDRLLTVSTGPNELHMFDPGTQSEKDVQLPAPPLSVAVRSDGLFAAVGHDGWVSYIDLMAGVVVKVLQLPIPAEYVVLPSNGYIFAGRQNWNGIYALEIATSQVTLPNPQFFGELPILTKDGAFMYSAGYGYHKWAISGGLLEPVATRTDFICAPLWMTETGNRIVSGCGQVHRVSSVPSEDLERNGTLGVLKSVVWADESASRKALAVLPGAADGQESDGSSVQLYDNAFLDFTGVAKLPVIVSESQRYTARGRFVFWNKDSSALIVVSEADGGPDVPSRYAVSVLTPSTPGQRPFTLFKFAGDVVSTNGTAVSTAVGWGAVELSVQSNAPAGLAIFGSRVNGVLVSEATVPATRAILAGRIYAEVRDQVNTGIAIANPNNSDATVSFYFTDESGNSFGWGTTTVAANSQIAVFLDQAPFNSGHNVNGTLTFNSDVGVAVVALRGRINERSEFLWTTLPVTALSEPRYGSTVLPHFAQGEGWSTQIVLVNTTDLTLTGRIRFYSQGTVAAGGAPLAVLIEGQTAESFPYSIPPRASHRFRMSSSTGRLQVGSVRVEPDTFAGASPVPLAIFAEKNGDGVTIAEAGVQATVPSNKMVMYAEITNDTSQIQTCIALTNMEPVPTTTTFQLYDLSGVFTGFSASVTIPANGQIAVFLSQLAGFENLPKPFRGILRITDSQYGVGAVGLRSRINERNEFLITTTMPEHIVYDESTANLYFPHVPDGGGYTTQIVLFSSRSEFSTEPVIGTVLLFSQNGQLIEFFAP